MEKNLYKKNKYDASQNDTRAQKLVAAVFLVTAHMSDMAPLKSHLRDLVLAFVSVQDVVHIAPLSRVLINVLEGAGYAKEISPKNTSIIAYEVRKYAQALEMEAGGSDTVADLFVEPYAEALSPSKGHLISPYKKTINKIPEASTFSTKMSLTTPTENNSISEIKNKRKDEIMSFINTRSATTLKDIQSAYPTISEKTIQRDLAVLVAAGDISKQGSKRWSLYLPK